MQRQLVKHGASTLMVSVPKKWIDAQGLRKGDGVSISVVEDKVIIEREERQHNKSIAEATIHNASYEEARTILGSLYRQGASTISLHFREPESLMHIQTICRAMHGFEIIEQEKNHCLIRNVAPDPEIDTAEVFSKLINIVKAQFLIVREYLISGTLGRESEIQALRDDCWKIRNIFYARLRHRPLSSAHDEYQLVHIIEHNASFLLWMYRSFSQNKSAITKEFLHLYDQVAEYFTGTMLRYRKKDTKFVPYVMERRGTLLRACEEHASSVSKDRHLVIYLSMLVQNIHNPKSLIA